MIKSKFADKFFIKQYIINNQKVADWLELNWAHINQDNYVIGYFFSVKEGNKLQSDIEVLNLYLINTNYYVGDIVQADELKSSWDLFSFKNLNEVSYKKKMVFKNPPIKEWIATKENWCMKLAHKLSKQYQWEFDDMLSEVYYTVMKLYNRKTVYMGNLGYIENSVNNSIRLIIRDNKNKLSLNNEMVMSLDTPINCEGEDISIGDMIAAPDEIDSELNYRELKQNIIKMLSLKFSQREIDQLLKIDRKDQRILLSPPLYNKLLHWRLSHNPMEVTNEQT